MSPPTPSKAAIAFAKAFVADTRKMPPPMTIGHEEALVAMLYDRHAASAWQGMEAQNFHGRLHLKLEEIERKFDLEKGRLDEWWGGYRDALKDIRQWSQKDLAAQIPAAPTPSGEPIQPTQP